MLVHTTEQATLWLDPENPTRMVWRGRRWKVTDDPTPIEEVLEHPLLTHGGTYLAGWRFQATDEDGETHVVDVRRNGTGWAVTAIYD